MLHHLQTDIQWLIVLLSYHSKDATSEIFRPEARQEVKKPPRCWSMALVRAVLGQEVCQHMPFTHAILGCDTTSCIFGLGKGVALKPIKKNELFVQQARVFLQPGMRKETIIRAGETAIVCLYNGQPGEGLDKLRLQ